MNATGKTVLWTAEQAAQATGGINTANWEATGLSLNTRTIEPGDLFFALQGPTFDGHDFVRDAFDKGASVAVVHHAIENLPDNAPLLKVDDTLAALNRMGAAARSSSPAKFVGVTGSAGKTSVKEALAHCLGEQAVTSASAASFNNHWGVPLSLCRMHPDSAFAINEMGMSAAGEIRELTKLVQPDVAIITTIAPAHMEFFNSLEEIAAAKSEIFESMSADGIAILNRDHELFEQMAAAARTSGVTDIRTFGYHPDATYRVLRADCQADRSVIEANLRGMEVAFTLASPGEHWIMNAAAVLAAVDALGADIERAMASLATLPGLSGRGERSTLALPQGKGTVHLIDESYNANPASVRAMLKMLGEQKPAGTGRRIAVLGDMLELGRDSERFHGELSEPVMENSIDAVYACGSQMQALKKSLSNDLVVVHEASSTELTSRLLPDLQDGDIIAVKGSLGSRMAVVVEALKTMDKTNKLTGKGEA
ncbi:UDP-N-acetylmuramoyl-tripeptide--D-alanyl-D-alanine ligase [Kiloniella sp. b19]|uniref:UDP-N-acetylmuramoyl-tripeptide--D-alanyl-D- alanine ligase n=1 Tax=Kiloniella sp. GXU_MW_B19 TaxID=3141326 RepID=UPI0031D06793